MPIFLGLIGVAGIAYLALRRKAGAEDSAGQAPPVASPAPPEIFAPLESDIMIDPFDRSTWPAGDKIWQFAQAIAGAEGYGVKASNAPTTHCNPGDLGPGDTGYPGEFHGGSNVSQLPSHEIGWQCLRKKLERCFAGKSSTFKPEMTFLQFAQKYAGDWQNWCNNVTRELGVPPTMRVIDWYNS